MNIGFLYLFFVITFLTSNSMELPQKKRYNRRANKALKKIAEVKNPSNREIREFVVVRGANPNIIAGEQKYEPWSLLRIAIVRASSDRELITLLLDRGANPNDISGPLHMAIKMRDLEAIRLLIQRGANVNMRNYWNETPLDVAIKEHAEEYIPFLINLGAEYMKQKLKIA